MLKVENLTKYYKDVKGVENLSLTLEKGKTTGIIGINGSGKTTMFRVLLGLLNEDSGIITFNHKNIREYPNSLFGYLPEERSLYKDLKVIDQVLLLGRLKNMNDRLIEERLDTYLDFLKISKYKFSIIGKLSKGNQQKIQIICALIHDPKVIILDEPLSGLDVINVSLLKNLIHKLKAEEKYILMSSHQFAHIEEFCDDLIILKRGDTMFSGSVKELISMSEAVFIKVEKEIGIQYVSHDSIIGVREDVRFLELKVKNRKEANDLFKEIMNKDKPINISLNEASIEDIVRGA